MMPVIAEKPYDRRFDPPRLSSRRPTVVHGHAVGLDRFTLLGELGDPRFAGEPRCGLVARVL